MRRLNSSYPYQKQLKNRSSKHLGWFVGHGHKNILRCVSGSQLKEWVDKEVKGALNELNRRSKKAKVKEEK